MKKLVLVLVFAVASISGFAQPKKSAAPQSPDNKSAAPLTGALVLLATAGAVFGAFKVVSKMKNP
ncbi:MAG: hypothetical protein KAH32_03530 [Chlamydiia bacterium]|nr:hypothetical protein [Chlamydiia bacterium]